MNQLEGLMGPDESVSVLSAMEIGGHLVLQMKFAAPGGSPMNNEGYGRFCLLR